MNEIRFNPQAIKFLVPKTVPQKYGEAMIHDWIIQKANKLYEDWTKKPDNKDSAEDPDSVKQRLYSEFEAKNEGQEILIIQDPKTENPET